MKGSKLLAVLGALGLLLPSLGMALPCIKCHKTEADLASKIKSSGAKDENELLDFLRNKSAKKAIHKSLSDEDIKKAFSLAKAKAEPAKQTTSTKPAEKAKTAQPTKKTKQTKKEANATHTEKAKPAEKAQPAEPAKPATPAQPAKPATPAEKAQPAQPKKKVEGC
jgi:outer membrane biosynthesis protein TonB